MFRMKPRYMLAALGLALLAACTPPAPVTQQVASFRKAGAPIWSAAAFMPPRIQGQWQQAAGFTTAQAQACAPGAVSFDGSGGQMTIRARLCLNGREVTASGPITMTGPGRFTVPGMGEWWVIWVDYDYRSMAIATPRGDFGFVLDRGKISGDRLVAAGEIFDFNGYFRQYLRRF